MYIFSYMYIYIDIYMHIYTYAPAALIAVSLAPPPHAHSTYRAAHSRPPKMLRGHRRHAKRIGGQYYVGHATYNSERVV